jgi:DNA-binding GntR family transcriptional regulator
VGYADKETAKMLLVRKGDPLLMMIRVVYDENGIPAALALGFEGEKKENE